MCAPSAPPPPDYAGAAVAQGQANKDAAIAGSQLSNPNVTNAYGKRVVSYKNDPVTGNPVPYIEDSFTPNQQKIFDTGQQTQQSLADLALTGSNTAGQILGQRFDIGSIPGISKTDNFDRESVYNALVARATDQNTRDRDATRSQLVAQGIPVGSKAYNDEMARLDRGLTDARQQANSAAGAQQQQQLDARRQMITEALANRQTPLNEISALRSGSQVAPLQFQNFSGQNVAPAPVFAAAQAQGTAAQQQFQSESQANAAMMNGLFDIGASVAGAPKKPWWMGG